VKFFIFVLLISLVVILAGIYKFNYTNDDIYVQDTNGTYVPIDEYEKRIDAYLKYAPLLASYGIIKKLIILSLKSTHQSPATSNHIQPLSFHPFQKLLPNAQNKHQSLVAQVLLL